MIGVKQTQNLQLNCSLCLYEFNIENQLSLVVNLEVTLLSILAMGEAVHLTVEAWLHLKLVSQYHL